MVEQHIQRENANDLEGVLDTFGDSARYADEPWAEHYKGRNGVRQFYEQLMKALPDLEIEVQRWHVAEDVMVVEVMIRGTHHGEWRGLPATGRRVDFPKCGIYRFDANDRLAGEKIYYDRGTVLRQLGIFHEPPSILGKSAFWRLTRSRWYKLSRGSSRASNRLAPTGRVAWVRPLLEDRARLSGDNRLGYL